MAQMVNEVMTPVPVSVSPDTSLVRVGDLMRQHGIGDVLVVHEGRLRGLVTDRDIVVRAVALEKDLGATPVADICSTNIVTVAPDADADDAVRLMRRHAVRRIPVVDGDRPIGMVSIGDLAVQRDERSALADISAEPPNT
ncbi:CBS domain protein [Actinomadura pelletieri DSM 43383]|uniref:CBS domain-containing protein n=2 Tax=Actinomadura TaxID=1988 RepID=A0A372G977_9ACTN|nr:MULTISPECIES: CBS domain-containing protein [Actinomadura]RFS81669.1 CBS domain-containing protein [Actinomadura spongiicola]RKS68732.1 CBS domain protein [Actinomadura pelletieri DSM 43383]